MAEELYSGVDNLEVLTDAVNYNRFLVDSVVRASKGAAGAVDFGAGEGTLSAAVRSRGLPVTCVEPDPRLQERLREQGFAVHSDIGRFDDDSLEFIYSLNVLEHIEDDGSALAALRSKLIPGGRLFLYVPAHRFLYSSMDRKIGHHRRYERAGLIGKARGMGFEVESAEYADSLGVVATLIYKLVGSRRGDISKESVKAYDRYIFPLSRALDRLGASGILGKNLMISLRKPRR
jgi:SAM-dependent methyltransferase